MPVQALVRPNAYYDSVVLMAVSRAAAAVPGVRDAVAMMGTAMNKGYMAAAGLLSGAAAGAGPGDLVVAVLAESDAGAAAGLAAAVAQLEGRAAAAAGAGDRTVVPTTLAGALARMPDANLALVSVPGEYAAGAARGALAAGLHVLVYSDNVPVADEVALKALAAERGLLCMGPDCGTAIIGGVGLGFANAVRRGPVGLVGASGTGLQEVAALVDRLGSGVSHAIGTGGRDLSGPVGGRTMLQGLDLLARDPETAVIVLLSKPPDPAVAQQVIRASAGCGKPAVISFLGGDPRPARDAGCHFAATLDEAALQAVALAGLPPPDWELAGAEAVQAAEEAVEQLLPSQRWVRGLFTGGTLCDQAALLLGARLGRVHANTAKVADLRLQPGAPSRGHSLWDLGDDAFTRGRPHPMIEPDLRTPHLLREAADPAVAVVLLDVLLGHGCHPDPAGEVADAADRALAAAVAAGRYLAVVAAVTGVDQDPQGYGAQVRTLRQAGILVAPTAARAARLAAAIAGRHPEWAGDLA